VTFASWIDELQEQEVDVAVPLTNDPLFHVYFVGLLVVQFSLNMKGKLMMNKMPVKIQNIFVPETVKEIRRRLSICFCTSSRVLRSGRMSWCCMDKK
jgi:hypothetical protein